MRADAAQRLASVLCTALSAALRSSPHLAGTTASALCGMAAPNGPAMPAGSMPQQCDGAAAAAGMECDVQAFMLPITVVGDVEESPSDYLLPATDRLALRVQAAASDWSSLVLAALPELATTSASVSSSANDASAMVAAAGTVLATGTGSMAAPPSAVIAATAGPQPDASSGSSAGVAVGVTIGVLAAAGIVAGLYIRARRRRGAATGPFRGSMGFGARSRRMDVGETVAAVNVTPIMAGAGPRPSGIALQPLPGSGSAPLNTAAHQQQQHQQQQQSTINPISMSAAASGAAGDRRMAAFAPSGTGTSSAVRGSGV